MDGIRGELSIFREKTNMSSLTQINDTQVSIVNFKSIPVVTTAMLADFYRTDTDNIKQNYSRNKGRFVEGKHFFKIIGEELKKFVGDFKSLANFPAISNKTRSLILWTERGAARHAKMLDTDQAWDVFEQLEDCYFNRQEILTKTHKSERTALHEAHALLVTKTRHLNVNEAWKLIHQRFGVDHIEDIPYDQIPVAVEYVHHLIALYTNADKRSANQSDYLQLIKDLVDSVLLQNCMTSCLYRAAYAFDNSDGMRMANFAFKTNIAVLKLTRAMDLRGPQKRKIISDDLKTASFTEGNQHYGSVWFHPLSDSGQLVGALQLSRKI